MAGVRCATTQLLVLTLVLVSTISAKKITCPPPSEDNAGPSIDEIFYYSDLVVLGRVVERYTKPKTPSVFTAEMEVQCVYKGGDRVPRLINITNAGSPSDTCFSTVFDVGESYLAYLHKHKDGRLTPAYPEGPDNHKDELYIMCDVNISYPIGLSKSTATVSCEDEQNFEEYYDDGTKVTCIPTFVPKNEPPYKPEKTQDEDNEEDKDPNGSGALRMSLILLALVLAIMLVVS